jgi:hypothetical protein
VWKRGDGWAQLPTAAAQATLDAAVDSTDPAAAQTLMNGIATLTMQDDGQVTVDMGAPVFEAARLPFLPEGLPTGTQGDDTQHALQINGRTEWLSTVSMGNPHAVTFDDVDLTDTHSSSYSLASSVWSGGTLSATAVAALADALALSTGAGSPFGRTWTNSKPRLSNGHTETRYTRTPASLPIYA